MRRTGKIRLRVKVMTILQVHENEKYKFCEKQD